MESRYRPSVLSDSLKLRTSSPAAGRGRPVQVWPTSGPVPPSRAFLAASQPASEYAQAKTQPPVALDDGLRSATVAAVPALAVGVATSKSDRTREDAVSPQPPAVPQVPVVPQSQDVKKFIKEPSYCTVLHLQREQQLSLPPAHGTRGSLSGGSLPSRASGASVVHTRPTTAVAWPKSGPHRPHPPVYVNCGLSAAVTLSEPGDGPRSGDSQGSLEEDLGPVYQSPPSPVSSSYSELRQATKYPPGYHFRLLQLQQHQPQQQQQQQQNLYDSLYEPIQSLSHYPVHLTAGSSTSLPAPGRGDSDLYKSSSSNSSESSDYFGLCFRCRHKIVGEGTGCSAMGRIYHLQCFTCHHCHVPLQGQPFYALDGKAFCQEGYMNTLEKCCKCLSPILDRILRATGKPYHPHCFTCLVCHRSLDGVPFTVDATNQIHCIEDFHRRFAPKCSVCQHPIMPEPGQEETVRVVALDRSFHVKCYKCEDCGLILSSDEEGSGCYPLDDHVLCKSCNTRRIQQLTSSYY